MSICVAVSLTHFPWVGLAVDEVDGVLMVVTNLVRAVGVALFMLFETQVADFVDDEFSLASADGVEYFTEVDDVVDVFSHVLSLVFAVAAVGAGEDAVPTDVAKVDLFVAFCTFYRLAVVE